jgi:hypothetical protein
MGNGAYAELLEEVSRVLHILNGDSTACSFCETGISGDTLVWREILSEGPVINAQPGEVWELREKYITETYGNEGRSYKEKVLDEVNKLDDYSKYDEIILWFEFDLLCQVNLIYILNWFSDKELNSTKLSLICIDEYEGIKDFRGLGQLTPEQLKTLYPERVPLNKNDLTIASIAWMAYTSGNPLSVYNLLERDMENLHLLIPALKSHLQRFPSMYNGLNKIQNALLKIIESGADNENAVIQSYFKSGSEKIFGIGDSQVLQYLKQLFPEALAQEEAEKGAVINTNGKLSLTPTGKALLEGKADFISLYPRNYKIGGAEIMNNGKVWRWDGSENKLILTVI